jgi:chemotaxis protein CheX
MSGAGRVVMVADDDVDGRKALVDELKKREFKVLEVSDGMQAAAIARQEKLDGIVVNIKLPSMSGLQVASTARSLDLNRHAAIVLIAKDIEKDHVTRAAQIGITDLLLKPVVPDEVISKMLAHFKADNSGKTYDTRIINAFVASVNEVLEFYFGEKPKLGKPTLKKEEKAQGYVSGLIGISGKAVQGSMSITSPAEFILELAGKIFAGQPVERNDQLMADLAGELCNQVVGKVKIALAKLGIKIQIGLPEVVIGKDHVVIHRARNPVITIPIKVGTSQTVVEFCFAPGVDEGIDESKAEASAEGVMLFD